MNPAQSSRLSKEKRPQDFCHDKKCLWRVTPEKPCPKHGTPVVVIDLMAALKASLKERAAAPQPTTHLCLRCHVSEPLKDSMLCRECNAERGIVA